MTPHPDLDRLFAEQLAGIEPPDAPVPADTERNREATPLPVWSRPKTTHGEL